ncbi:hypothetical protein, partial [Helicobacter rodentium]
QNQNYQSKQDYQSKNHWQKAQGQAQGNQQPPKQNVFIKKVEADVNSTVQQEIDKEFETFSKSFAGKGLNKDWFNEIIEQRNNLMNQQKDYESGSYKYPVNPNTIQSVFEEYSAKAQQGQDGNRTPRVYERLEAKIEEQSAQISHLIGLVEKLADQLLETRNTATTKQEQYDKYKAELTEENNNYMQHRR